MVLSVKLETSIKYFKTCVHLSSIDQKGIMIDSVSFDTEFMASPINFYWQIGPMDTFKGT